MIKYATQPKTRQQQEEEHEQDNDRIMEIVNELKEREKRKILRQLQNGEIDFDAKLGKLVYTDTKEELEIGGDDSADSDDDFWRVTATWAEINF